MTPFATALTSSLSTATDITLAVLLVLLAAGMLFLHGLFRAVTLFVVFGLLAAIAWVRLGAFDVAIAEAAIGAALVGVLFIDAAREFEHSPDDRPRGEAASPGRRSSPTPQVAGVALAACGATITILALSVSALSTGTPGPRADVAAAVAERQVQHPVTAVLLDFRAYDTLLEIAVLFVVAAAALMLSGHRAELPPEQVRTAPPAAAIRRQFAARIVPIAVLVGVWVLAAGSTQPGGAFQAGSVLAAAALLAGFGGLPSVDGLPRILLVACLATGVVTFALAGVASLAISGSFLAWPAGQEKAWILTIEIAATISIGVTLIAMFLAARRAGARQ